MTVDFCDHFWGDKCNGFDTLYHNMKYGQIASKELVDFLRERSYIEETHSKLLAKLAKQCGNCNTNGTFSPLWQVLKSSSEKLSGFHQQMVQKFQELVKDVSKYCDEQHRKHKQVKDEEAGTLEIVQAIQSTTGTLIKAKETFSQRCLEYEKLKRDNALPKELEKAEVKYKKAGDEYRSLVEKYSAVRDEFEKKMTISCRHFQDVEEDHLRKMKLFLDTYSQVIERGHTLFGQVYIELRQQCHETSVEKLLEQLVQTKATGYDRPACYEFRWEGPMEFEEADLSSLPSPPLSSSTGDAVSGGGGERTTNGDRMPKGNHRHQTERPSSPIPNSLAPAEHVTAPNGSDINLSRNTFRGSKWFLKSRRERKKKKKRGELSSKENIADNKDLERKEDGESGSVELPPPEITMSPTVDDEGYTIRPELEHKELEKGNFYSSSDSDSDDEKEKRIHIEIKPLTNGSAPLNASIDELRASVGGLVISPIGGYTSSLCLSRLPPYAPSLSPRGGANVQRHRNPDMPLKNRRTPTSELESPMKRSMSVSQPLGKPSNDLLSLSFSQSPAPSSASTPTGAYGGSTSSPTSTGTGASFHSPPTSIGSGGKRSAESTPTPTPTPTPTKYRELGDLFSELGDLPPALPPKHSIHQQPSSSTNVAGASTSLSTSGTSTSRSGTPVGSLAIPRPPSRPRAVTEGAAPMSRGRASPSSPMSRAESVSSLSSDFRSSSMSVGSSRGPSPLTIGMSDTIPLAIAFQEIVHAYFRGTDETMCQVKLAGDMMFSFPAGIVQVLANNPSPSVLSFRLKNTNKLEHIVPNKQLVSMDMSLVGDNHVYEFNMTALTGLLRKQAEQNPAASYFNVDILKYQIKSETFAQSAPLQLVAYWKCESQNTDLRLDYKYNGSAMASPLPLLNLSILVPVDGGVATMQSKPNGTWISDTQRAVWRFTELSQHSDNNGMGSVRARFDLKAGPSCPGTIAAQFSCERTTLSGVEFELVGFGYRVSLVKRRFITGKYICETEPDMKYRYAPPP